ncbi:MAG: hypothetical protein EU547_03935 [Promethearchaeota archaeon]|nr:MAG: hypothetical protein EU547_03935 [Candidatus Lokiarchaeota archaeon]
MRDILGVYIIDNDAKVFFEQEIYSQGSENINEAILSRIIITLQKFAEELGGGNIHKIEIGKNQVFILGDELTEYKFILWCNQKIKQKMAQNVLGEIKNIFIDTFMGQYHKDQEKLIKLKSKFSDKISKLFEKPKDVSGFLKKI